MLVIVQSRCSSKRFPNKALYPIKSVPLILRVLKNITKSRRVTDLIVSTSTDKSDDRLVRLLKFFKYNYYRGSLENVALRLLNTALKKKVKFFVRISGDSPLIDPKLIDKAIKKLTKNKNADIITNIFPRSFPQGQSVEIIKIKTLKKNISKMTSFDKEHVTPYFYSNHQKFKIVNFKENNSYYKNLPKLSVDFKSDVKKILKYIKND